MADEARWGQVLFPPGHVATGRLAPVVVPQQQHDKAPEPREREPESSSSSEVLSSFSTDPTVELPKTVAQLVIRAQRRDGVEFFTVQGSSVTCELPHHTDHRYGRPKLALAKLISRDGYLPVQTYHALRDWSCEKTELHRWLNELRIRHGEDLNLIIWDDTDYEIPWELFWLPPVPAANLQGGWLGAVMSVTRNTTVTGPRRQPMLSSFSASSPGIGAPADTASADADETDDHRPVVAFIHEEMARDRTVIEPLRPQYVDSFQELLELFEDPLSVVTLAYVACHGRFGANEFEIYLDEVSLVEVGSAARDLMTSPPELVFLNACHTARPMLGGVLRDANPRGFSQLFLRAGSCGVIGTTGEVGLDNGRVIAEAIISRLTANPDVPIAAALRDHRRALARKVPHPPPSDPSGQRAMLLFFHTFMYVYYGDPAARLRLRPGQDVAQ